MYSGGIDAKANGVDLIYWLNRALDCPTRSFQKRIAAYAISTGAKMGIPIANAVTFSEAPGGTAPAFDAVSKVATAYRAGDADYAQHLSKAAKK